MPAATTVPHAQICHWLGILCSQEGIVDVFESTTTLDTLVAEHKYRDDTLYYQLVTTAGVHRVYPGVTVPDNYDPLQEAW